MTPDMMLDVMTRGIILAAECSGPLLAIGGGVGLFMALIQAATQVQEASLTFVPKLASVGLGLILLGGWLVDRLVAFNVEMYQTIANVGP